MTLAAKVASVVECWTLDEESGNRTGSVAGTVLVDGNTVGSAAGKFGNAADFEFDNTEYLQVDSAAVTTVGDIDWWVLLWFKKESDDAAGIIRKLGAGNDPVWGVRITGGDLVVAKFLTGSGGAGETSQTLASLVGDTDWHMLYLAHDATNNLMLWSIDGASQSSVAHAGGVWNSDGAFNLGVGDNGGVMDGLMDEVVLGKNSLLTNDELTEAYNSGTGVAFADWDGGDESSSSGDSSASSASSLSSASSGSSGSSESSLSSSSSSSVIPPPRPYIHTRGIMSGGAM